VSKPYRETVPCDHDECKPYGIMAECECENPLLGLKYLCKMHSQLALMVGDMRPRYLPEMPEALKIMHEASPEDK